MKDREIRRGAKARCLNPLVGLKNYVFPLFMSIDDDTVDTHSMIHFTNISLNPNLVRRALRNFQFTLLNAFCKSIFIATKPPFTFLFLKLCRISWTRTELTEKSVLGLGLNGEVKSVLVVGGSTEWVNAGAWGWV